MTNPFAIAGRFRGFLPVVVDVETGGFNCRTDALLDIAAVLVDSHEDGTLTRGETFRYHVKPFEGANMEPASLAVNGIAKYFSRSQARDQGSQLHSRDTRWSQFIIRSWVSE